MVMFLTSTSTALYPLDFVFVVNWTHFSFRKLKSLRTRVQFFFHYPLRWVWKMTKFLNNERLVCELSAQTCGPSSSKPFVKFMTTRFISSALLGGVLADNTPTLYVCPSFAHNPIGLLLNLCSLYCWSALFHQKITADSRCWCYANRTHTNSVKM